MSRVYLTDRDQVTKTRRLTVYKVTAGSRSYLISVYAVGDPDASGMLFRPRDLTAVVRAIG
jgi:hypothetical protein